MYVGGAYMEVRVQRVGIDPLLPQWGSQQWNQGHQIWGRHPSQLSHHLISFVHLSPTRGVKFLYQFPLNLHLPPRSLLCSTSSKPLCDSPFASSWNNLRILLWICLETPGSLSSRGSSLPSITSAGSTGGRILSASQFSPSPALAVLSIV